MTNKEAIEYLKEVQSHIDLENGGNTQKMYDAIDMAIKALEDKKEAIEKIDRVFCELGVECAYDMPSFWAKDKKGKSKYAVIPDKWHKGYQQSLTDAERRIKEIFGEAENEQV